LPSIITGTATYPVVSILRTMGLERVRITDRIRDQSSDPPPDHLGLEPARSEVHRVLLRVVMAIGRPGFLALEVGGHRDQVGALQPEDHHPIELASPTEFARGRLE
jgi:hypothetical protein